MTPTWRWSAQDFISADGLPYFGAMSATSRLYVATGFAKWGLTNGTAAAIAISESIGGRAPDWTEPFAASRITPIRSAKMVLSQVAATARSLVLDRLKTARASTVEELLPGEGAVAQSEDGPVGIYLDETGAVHRVSVVCTHMGCMLRFNQAERSWDCPCHGSRFDTLGDVLNGPATEPLKRLDPAE